MPELPEVETTRRTIEPYLNGQVVRAATVRQRALRWPVPRNLHALVQGQKVLSVDRRGKYLLLQLMSGTLLIHLGMSGHLRILPVGTPAEKHDHVDIILSSQLVMRLTDPRRFGAVLWIKKDPLQHSLLAHLGPEPLEKEFSGNYLFEKSRKRKTPIKSFIMDSKLVVGVGNIYANEALYRAGIRPTQAAGRLSASQCESLVDAIRAVLEKAIRAGGTTLRDFLSAEGKTGYFQQELLVYGRGGEPCLACRQPLKEIRLGQRSTVYCSHCQS